MSWSTSELRVRLAPLNRFKPSSKIFYWPFQGSTSFVDLLCFCSVLYLLCFVRVCLYVLCGHLLGKGWPLGSRLWCLLWVCHFPIGILGQVWYLIVSNPDLCNLITFIILVKLTNSYSTIVSVYLVSSDALYLFVRGVSHSAQIMVCSLTCMLFIIQFIWIYAVLQECVSWLSKTMVKSSNIATSIKHATALINTNTSLWAYGYLNSTWHFKTYSEASHVINHGFLGGDHLICPM